MMEQLQATLKQRRHRAPPFHQCGSCTRESGGGPPAPFAPVTEHAPLLQLVSLGPACTMIEQLQATLK
jgi:hypothetical protein